MVGIPTADEFMKNKDEFDAKIDDGSDELNAGLLLAYSIIWYYCCHLSTSLLYPVWLSKGFLAQTSICIFMSHILENLW